MFYRFQIIILLGVSSSVIFAMEEDFSKGKEWVLREARRRIGTDEINSEIVIAQTESEGYSKNISTYPLWCLFACDDLRDATEAMEIYYGSIDGSNMS